MAATSDSIVRKTPGGAALGAGDDPMTTAMIEVRAAVDGATARHLTLARPGAQPPLPHIFVDTDQHRDTAAQLLKALHDANGTLVTLFRRGGDIVTVTPDEGGRPRIVVVDERRLRRYAADVADWYKWSGKGEAAKPAHATPPQAVLQTVLAMDDLWPFPVLDGITECPVVRPDGTIHDTPGYDAVTKLYYLPAADLHVPPVPTEPDGDDVRRAVAIFDDLLCDFKFEDAASRANMIAAFMTPILAPSSPEGKPLILLTMAHTQGSGKSFLAEMIGLIASGEDSPSSSAPGDEAEWKKEIFTYIREGHSIHVFDNVTGTLGSDAFSVAATTPIYSGRILGLSESGTYHNRVIWAASGNNMTVSGDMQRRVYEVWIDPGVANPAERDPATFRHPDIKGYCREQRGHLIWATLVMARAWWAAGQPSVKGFNPGGRFQKWAETMRCILAHAGFVDESGTAHFLANKVGPQRTADPEQIQWAAFLEAWHRAYGEEWLKVGEIGWSMRPNLEAAIPGKLAASYEKAKKLDAMRGFETALGTQLRVYHRRRFECSDDRGERLVLYLDHKPGRGGATLWHVAADTTPPAPADDQMVNLGEPRLTSDSDRLTAANPLECRGGDTPVNLGYPFSHLTCSENNSDLGVEPKRITEVNHPPLLDTTNPGVERADGVVNLTFKVNHLDGPDDDHELDIDDEDF